MLPGPAGRRAEGNPLAEVILVGAGGHARGVVAVLQSTGHGVSAYVDPHPAPWLSATHYADEDALLAAGATGAFALGIGGVTPDALEMRLGLFERLRSAGLEPVSVIHPAATVSADARIEPGAMVLAGAVVQPDAVVGAAAIVNTGAILEHDTVIEEGSHLAPGAIVLGGCRIGRCAMIGAGAVVLPRSTVPAGTTVAAATRFPK